jgi:hypothetical protein
MIDFINNLTLVYSNAQDCLETNNKDVFWVGEDNVTKKSFIVHHEPELEEKEVLLEINNPHTKDINLLCIDACIFSSSDSSRCDCALFDDDKFCYCELKYEVQNIGTASKNLQKARNLQLSNTISLFSSKIDFSLFSKIEAYVVLKKRLYPNRPARLSELKTAFWDKHKVEYFEDKEIVFDAPIKKSKAFIN